MKTRTKALIIVVSVMLLISATVAATIAFLTDRDSAVNVFTVGNVNIKLDEAPVDENGVADPEADRVQKNEYHIIPGGEYDKDPMVTVLENSEESYVRMLVTVDKLAEFDAIFAPEGADLASIFTGVSDKWIYFGESEDETANTITYEFRYATTAAATGDGEVALEPLFTGIKIPEFLTGEQLAAVAGFEISVEAHAIQAKSFADANEAWSAFAAQVNK